MYHFLQFRPDKKEPWRMYTEEQLQAATLSGPPAFKTVLMVDQNPEEVAENGLDPIETVHYMGPMYLDFDSADDIDQVLHEVNAVLDYLMNKLDIPSDFIHCWLSGGKGVHITIPAQVFGIKKATKFLPMIYREIMLTILKGAGLQSPCTLDESVYSCGRGRMWRCEGIPRPGSGTYKVGTTPNELAEMDSEIYHAIVAEPRPPLNCPEPGKNISFAKAEQLLKSARVAATRKVRAMNAACVVPKEAMREWDGIPGCIEKLITEGHADGSNWNQTAMQLAAYIAARYEKSEEKEYMELLVRPFVKNVQSSSRPSETERLKHVQGQLHRTFSGSIKFAPGALIASIGSPCRACPICRADVASGETTQETVGNYNNEVRIRWDDTGYYLVGEESSRQLTNFTFWPELEVFELEPYTNEKGFTSWRNTERKELIGKLIVSGVEEQAEISLSERAWGSKRDLISGVKGRDAAVYAGDGEIQKLLVALLKFARDKTEDKELDKMIRANVCGIVLDRGDKGTVAHYVEAGNAITSLGGRSPFRFNGNARQSPALIGGSNPLPEDVALATAMKALTKVNEPVQVAQMLGWFVSCHFREHIQFEEPQFPLMNIYGNAGAGKSCLAMLMAMINGIDYTKAELQNVEVGTLFPLTKYVSSSTTVPRLIEEVNPVQLGNTRYGQIVGILKAAWSHAPIQRGKIGSDRELGISEDRVSAPLVYTSEQSATVPALRSRSVEVRLQAKSLQNPVYRENYRTCVQNKASLLRMARALVTVALGTSPTALLKIFHSKSDLIHKGMEDRPRWGMQCCLTGLHMLIHTMTEFGVGGVEEVQMLEKELIEYLGGRVSEVERGKSASEVDRVLGALNIMADETFDERLQLVAGKHYWRQGDSLYLVLQSCLPRYQAYSKSIGEMAVIRQYQQMTQLIEGEVYYERTEPHPNNNEIDVFVIDVRKLQVKGTTMNNFMKETEAAE
jgi:hypothetical protein